INDRKGHKLTPAEIGDSSKVQVGDTVVAIGNALGQFENTVTSGIISGYGRSVVASDSGGDSAENLDDLFQTDAAINQGNSGGPLVNTEGKVIGINTAVSGEGQNLGFAIPINDVNGLIKQVLSSGKFERPYLGVRYVRLTPDVAKQYKLNVDRGAFVLPSTDPAQPSVLPDSPADKAGIRSEDIITAIGNTKIDEKNSLTSLIGQHAVGDKVQLSVLRDGKTIKLNIELAAMPQS
ncbi:MAG: putative HtrA2 peptidase, partial [Candidatus Saccharibacteria bacterium]|nr:putative HtrA2 peptidase [Candidatus Saccharibacteria bacterium]